MKKKKKKGIWNFKRDCNPKTIPAYATEYPSEYHIIYNFLLVAGEVRRTRSTNEEQNIFIKKNIFLVLHYFNKNNKYFLLSSTKYYFISII